MMKLSEGFSIPKKCHTCKYFCKNFCNYWKDHISDSDIGFCLTGKDKHNGK